MDYRILLNPAAGSGAAARRLPAIERAFQARGMACETKRTSGPGDATRLAREAREDGVACLVVVGGDGTLNEVVQAYLDADGQVQPGPDLALVPAGTGGDFRRSFALRDNAALAAARIASATSRPVDLGVVELTGDDGARVRRAFLNIAAFGLAGVTDRIVNAGPKWIGGRPAFLLGAVRGLMVYRNLGVEVKVDGKLFVCSPVLNVAIANCRYFGGGMHIAPDADPSDGLFDVVALTDLSRAQALALIPHIYRGTHLDRPGTVTTRGSVVEATPLRSGDRVLLDMDGEASGRLPLRAEIRRHALRLRG